MARTKSWETRLIVQIEHGDRVAFEWGRCDCFLWVADCVKAISKKDIGRRVRGQYKSPRGALVQIKRRAQTLEGLVVQLCEANGFVELDPPTYAQRGDIVIIRQGNGIEFMQKSFDCAVAICAGLYLLAKTPRGVEKLPLHRAERAWRVN